MGDRDGVNVLVTGHSRLMGLFQSLTPSNCPRKIM